ncbi:MAG: diguanylate cyclase domain-containing protein, partial [Alphaproteobacteria bacterium]
MEPPPSGHPGGVIRVLLACNDSADHAAVAEMLTGSPWTRYSVHWASGYGAAIRDIATYPYDVLVIDMQIDGGLGNGLLREAKESRATVPVIMFAAHDDPALSVLAVQAGAADCLPRKALGPALLDRAIRFSIERKQMDERLVRVRDFDQVTGLANKTHFREILNRSIAKARQSENILALLVLGLDRLQLVNETLGHAGGDQLIKAVTERLRGSVLKEQTIARVSHDEFMIVLDQMDAMEDAGGLADAMCRTLASPFEINGHEVAVTVNIGIATYPMCGWDADTLSNSANTAMHRARERGHNSYQFYTRTMTTDELQRLVLQTSLH